MSMDRRQFMRNGAATAAVGLAGAQLVACGTSPASGARVGNPDVAAENPFKHGLASGDPCIDKVVIWTRITQVDEFAMPVEEDVQVLWKVYSDPDLTSLVTEGVAIATLENDYCVKVDVNGLMPYTTYYYQFSTLGFDSVIGRAQTLPDWGADTLDRLRIAVVSCSNYPHGFFHVYREIAERNDIDFVIHLGDYLYEYGDGEYGDSRPVDPPHEMISLDDYRRRHALYKTDPDLAELHRQYSFINIWDDHETTDNSRKCTANNHTEAEGAGLDSGEAGFNEGYWYERKTFGIKAFFEWMPIRPVEDDQSAAGELFAPKVGKTWRTFNAGNFVDFIMIDTRLWGRDDQASGAAFTKESVRNYQSADPDCNDTTVHRDMLGPDQEQWLHEQLSQSTAKWKVIGNQLIMSHLRTTPRVGVPPAVVSEATYLNTDAWDGYPTTQERMYAAIKDNAVDNVVVLTGDIHTSWAFDITSDPDALPTYDPLAVEFVGPSVTSPGLPVPGESANVVQVANPHLKYVNLDQKGWVLLDLTADHATGEWYHIGTDEVVDAPERPGPSRLARAYRTSSVPGQNGLETNFPDLTGADKQTQLSSSYLNSRPPMAP